MPGRVEGKVAVVTGAARGQGRSHAVRLAQEGADVIAIDLAAQVDSVPYPLASREDLEETGRLVKGLGRRVVVAEADVRNYQALRTAIDSGVAQLGRLDIVVVNAGILSYSRLEDMAEATWQDMIDVNLTGVWHTAKAAIPHLRATGGGSIVLTSSVAGVSGLPNVGHYTAAKHGVVGLMRNLAQELGAEGIRANSVLPTMVDTDMVQNPPSYALFAPDLPEEQRTREVIEERFRVNHLLPVSWVEPVDISNAVLWLASDEARYVTGVTLPVDAGLLTR